jgi:hypothetical protein
LAEDGVLPKVWPFRRRVEATLLQGIMNDFLRWLFVLDHEDYRRAFHFPLRAA